MNERLSSELGALRIDRAPAAPAEPRSRVWIAGLVALSIGAGAALSALGRARATAPAVKVAEIAPRAPAPEPAIELTTTGYVVPQRVARVGAKVSGRIIRSAIREGQAVKAGALLFELDAGDQESALAAAVARAGATKLRAKVARSSLAETEQLLARERRLVASGASPAAIADDLAARAATLAASVEAADADVAAGLADVRSLSTALRNLEIHAPIDGVATTRPAEVGDVVVPGAPLVELSDPASLLIEADVPEARLAGAREGAPCEVVLDMLPDRRLRAEVALVGPRVSRAKAMGLVKVKLLSEVPGLKPDMAARVSFLARTKEEP